MSQGSERDDQRESLTRQLFVGPQDGDADSSDEATVSISLEELQEMGREQGAMPEVRGPGGFGPTIQHQTPSQPSSGPNSGPAPQFTQQPGSQPHASQPTGVPVTPQQPKRKVPGLAIAMVVIAALVALGVGGYIVYDQVTRTDRVASGGQNPAPDNNQPNDNPPEGNPKGSEGDDSLGGDEPTQSEDPAQEDVKAFMAPSSNIVCTIDSKRARCTIRVFDYDPGATPSDCKVDPYGSVVVVEKKKAGFSCVRRGLPTEADVLDYGETVSAHGFTCSSAEDGIRCKSSQGASFHVQRAAVNFKP